VNFGTDLVVRAGETCVLSREWSILVVNELQTWASLLLDLILLRDALVLLVLRRVMLKLDDEIVDLISDFSRQSPERHDSYLIARFSRYISLFWAGY
jgi:hypothetical protein